MGIEWLLIERERVIAVLPAAPFRSRRIFRAGAAAAVVVALLAGCGSGPSEAGSAAIIGETAIPLATIQGQLDYAFARPQFAERVGQLGGKPADYSRELVSRSVQQALLAEVARREGITVTEQAVADGVRTAATAPPDSGLEEFDDPASLPDRVRADLIATELGRRYVDRLAVAVDLTEAQSREEAEAKARRIASSPDEANAVFTADRRAQLGRQFQSASNPALAATVLFGTPQGRVVYFQTDAGWTVMRVTQRRTDATPPAGDPATRLAAELDPKRLQMIGLRLLQPLADELGVRVNPRYGLWDQLLLRAVAQGNQAGMMLPASAR